VSELGTATNIDTISNVNTMLRDSLLFNRFIYL